MVSTFDIHWVAGLLEGEGCFTWFSKNGKKYPHITLQMTDRDIVEKVRDIMDPAAKVYTMNDKRSNRKTTYQTGVRGPRSIEWMMTLYSLMGERRKTRIREILEYWKTSSIYSNPNQRDKQRKRSELSNHTGYSTPRSTELSP